MLLITSIIASALTIIFIKLSFPVIRLRRKNKIGLGSGGHEDLERAILAQGNFAEYVAQQGQLTVIAKDGGQ
ncbi:MAPEG family protein [Polynucleobacter sp. 39-46-10]|jgi:uncharacterized membrane protein YecN with MAPEG domain|uniref:MAPEG family protein n=1 Tax=Polynucleobacter sp. 39-46-10 TaxID=1970428 RepID=UPI0025F83764|nr:MAPEG family protein [Polynucleobacter sp. 39-46-10]